MPSLIVNTAKWTLAACGVLALPLFAVLLIFIAYFVADAIRSFGGPALTFLLALIVGGHFLRKRYARVQEPI